MPEPTTLTDLGAELFMNDLEVEEFLDHFYRETLSPNEVLERLCTIREQIKARILRDVTGANQEEIDRDQLNTESA